MLLDTPVCDFGWQAPMFTLADASGKAYGFDDVMGENGLLVAFICNHCPYVIAVIDRLVADAGVLQNEGVGVVAIMPNDYRAYPADAPEAMTQFANAHGFTFPYLIDEDQSIARAYDAVCTPDFFGFDKTGGLQYRGRIDDAKMKDASNRIPELLNAMRQVAKTGHGPKEQTPSMGCSIKWKQA
jgi:peroxiredoxin